MGWAMPRLVSLRGLIQNFWQAPFIWESLLHFPFVPFEISRNHALIPAADLGKGREGLDFLLFLDLTKGQRAQKIIFFWRLPPHPSPPLTYLKVWIWQWVHCKGRSRGRVQGVHTPPPTPDLRFSNTTGILQKKKKELCGLLVLK